MSRLSYGWVVLGASFVIVTMAIGTLFSLAVFLKPLEESMGWNRSSVSAIALMNWIAMGVGSFGAGYLSDRFGTRRVVLAGGVLVGGGLMLSGRVEHLWQFYVTFGVLVGFGVSCFYVPLTVTALRWFEHRRGLAASIVPSGNGLGMALAPLTRWLINAYDRRTAFLVLGELALLIVISMALLLRPAPAPHGPAASAASPGGPGALYALAMIFGVGYGSVMPLYAVVTREYFGERAIGTAYGSVFLISCIGMGLGSYAGGIIIHDLLGSYLWLFLGSGAVATMAIVLAVSLRAPRKAVRYA